ncbi:MAG: DUF1573 domain-containing protein [Candidatus Omnitrophica bacterium]|nr:DUF1573 domain-containing protein [Candidatus Omnitrophota bacterium]
MRKVLLFTVCFLFILSVGLAQLAEPDTNTWDFGKIRASEGIVKHTFLLKNDSIDDLNINGTHASCGCTVSEIDKKVILPKETANLAVKFDPKGYSGQITQYVYVDTDSKTMPIYKFIIKADVINDSV